MVVDNMRISFCLVLYILPSPPTHTSQLPYSRRQSKCRMIITQIIRISLLQPPIPISPLPLLILPLDQEKQSRARQSTDPQHAQTNTIARRILGLLAVQEDIRSNNASDISKTDLHSRRDAAFVVARHNV